MSHPIGFKGGDIYTANFENEKLGNAISYDLAIECLAGVLRGNFAGNFAVPVILFSVNYKESTV